MRGVPECLHRWGAVAVHAAGDCGRCAWPAPGPSWAGRSVSSAFGVLSASHRRRRWPRAAGLLLGCVADAVLGDPVRGHPVAGFGRFAGWLERRCYADSAAAGIGYLGLAAGTAVTSGAVLARLVRSRPGWETMPVAATTWAVLGGTSLCREAAALAEALDGGDLPAARALIPHLCARDPYALDAAGMARAGCESVAENTSDAVVGPLLFGAVAGLPGLLGYRAVNTLDAMVGYRSARYQRFGWAAARLDDLVNLVPSRVAALLSAALAPAVGGSPSAALA